MHVIYKSDNLNDAGLYVGSAIVLAERVKKRKKDRKGFQKRLRPEGTQTENGGPIPVSSPEISGQGRVAGFLALFDRVGYSQ